MVQTLKWAIAHLSIRLALRRGAQALDGRARRRAARARSTGVLGAQHGGAGRAT